MLGTEDLAMGKESIIFFGSSGNLAKCFLEGAASADNGAIWMLDMKISDPEPSRVEIVNYPHDSIHVHGLYVSNKTDRLYFVNHLGPTSTIEVLKIEYSPALSLIHLKTVESSLFPRYGINDVVEGLDENEIYVSGWQVFSFPEHGKSNPEYLMDTIQIVLSPVILLLGMTFTGVYKCDMKTDTCEWATDRIFVGANGMTITPDRSTIFVSDPTEKRVAVMKRKENGFLELDSWIPLPFGTDNLEFDSASGEILLGTIPDFKPLIGKEKLEDVSVPGGLSILKLENGEWLTKDILMHDGSKLSQISAAARFGNAVVIGTPHSKGILFCTV